MENFSSMINNDEQFSEMAYDDDHEPMQTVPSELEMPEIPPPPSDIVNLSFNQRVVDDGPPQPAENIIENALTFPEQPLTAAASDEPQSSLSQSSPTSTEVENEPKLPDDDQNAVEDSEPPTASTTANEENPLTTSNNGNNDDETTAAASAAVTPDDGNNEEIDVKPTITRTPNKQPDVDPNQCRVCKAAEQLVDIFAIEEDMRICDIITKICTDIRIHERDFLPHMICLSCLCKLRTTFAFVNQIRETDKELRSKLKRSAKARKTNDFVLLDAPLLSDEDESEEEDLPDDDDEFKVSESDVDESDSEDSISEVEEEDDDGGDDDDEGEKKKKPAPAPKRMKIKVEQQKKTSRKAPVTASAPVSSSRQAKRDLLTTVKRIKRDIVFIEADESEEEERRAPKERCRDCNKSFSNKNSLKLHRKNVHTEEFPFKCKVCTKSFKYSINLVSHMQVHKESYTCDECGRAFASKSDSKKHALNQHKCSLSYECNKCRRLFCSVKRYQRHRENCSSGSNATSSSSHKNKSRQRGGEDASFGSRDLFASVAPVTTTYWSDSFSD